MRRNVYELATPGPATMALEASKHIATCCAIERIITRRSFEQWLRAKLCFVGKKGTPPDIAMKFNAAPGIAQAGILVEQSHRSEGRLCADAVSRLTNEIFQDR